MNKYAKRKRGVPQVIPSESLFGRLKGCPKEAPLTARSGILYESFPCRRVRLSHTPCLASWVGLTSQTPEGRLSPSGTGVSPIPRFAPKGLDVGRIGEPSIRLLSSVRYNASAEFRSGQYQVGNLIPHSMWTRLGDNTCANIDVIAACISTTSYTLPYISTKGGEQGTYIIPQWDILTEFLEVAKYD